MRAWLVGIIAAALGGAAAWGATRYEFRHAEQAVVLQQVTGPQPKVVVEGGANFNFGTMQLGQTLDHKFILHNVGDAPLELTAGRPSCKCTISEMEAGPVPPGESREVLVTWTPKGIEENFRQRAPIHTNDPERPEIDLQIGGDVREFYKLEPTQISLGQFSPTESSTYEIKVWGYLETPWKMRSYECLDADNARYFSLEATDMTPKQIAGSPGAVNGQMLTLTVKPGISLGHVRQRLAITYNDEPKPIEVTISGRAVGDITVVGKDYSTAGDYIDLGNVPKGTGKKSKVSLLVKGAHRDQVKLKIVSVDPASSLKAQLGEPVSVGGKSISWPLLVEIPSDAATANRIGSEVAPMGRIVFQTGTPDVPDFNVRVRFSVTEDQ